MGTKPKQTRVSPATQGGAAAAAAPVSAASEDTLLQLSREPMLIVNAETLAVADCNQAACALYGFSREELLGRCVISFSPERERELARSRFERGRSGRREFHHLTRKGASLFVEFDPVPFTFRGQPALLCAVHDITERSQLIRALLESDARNREIVENATDIIYTHDLQGNFTSANRAVTRLLGYTPDEYLTMSIADVVVSEDLERVRQSVAAKVKGTPVANPYRLRVRAKDGRVLTLEVNTRLIVRDGAPAGVQGVARDVTERVLIEGALRESEAKFRDLFHRNLAGVYLTTVAGEILDCNESFARMYGFASRAEALAHRATDLYFAPEHRQAFLDDLRRTRGYSSVEALVRRKDGSPLWVLESATLLEAHNGEPEKIQGTMVDITVRKLAEERLRESEAKFRAVAETAASAIYIHNGRKFLYVNRSSQEISGYTRDELLSLDPFAIVHPGDRELVLERARARQRGDENVPARYEYRVVRKDGGVRWVDFSASSIQFEGQAAILATAFDITQRKRIERLQQALYRIAEGSSEPQDLEAYFAYVHQVVSELMYAKNFYIALLDAERKTVRFPYYADELDTAPAGEQPLMHGATEYVIRRNQATLLRRDDFARLEAAGEIELIGSESVDWIGAPLRAGAHVFGAIVAQTYDESVRYSEDELEVLSFVAQHLAHAILRKRDEDALRHSEQRYRSMVQSAVYGIYRSSLEDRFLEVNPALVRMLGYERAEELLALRLSIDVYADGDDRRQLIDRYAAAGRVENVEVKWKRRDGRLITVRLSGRAVPGHHGRVEAFEMIVEDVTERRALEEQLRQSQKMEAVGRLAGGVAHDFNNLLTVIRGYTELMLEELKDGDPLRTEADEIRRAADRAAALTRQLLAFSRQQVLAPKVLDLNAILGNMHKLLERLLGADIDLKAVLADDLGRVKADPGQVEQVVMNLAVNARDAMPQGGKLTIETANVEFDEGYAREHIGAQPGRFVMIAVSDNGMGMSDAVRQRVFEPFFTTKEAGKGTGLGLSTVYGIVKQSGGYIWVYSEVGVGTSFKVYLPRVDAVAEAPRTVAPRRSTYAGTETVLLVEDEDGVRALIKQVLQRHGYSVLEARHGGEALLHCERHKGQISLLLTDVVLEQIAGPELARRLLTIRPQMRVLYISGYTDDAIIHHGVMTADTAFLQKPFTTEALAKKIREVLDA